VNEATRRTKVPSQDKFFCYVFAAISAAVPIFAFVKILHMDLQSYAILFGVTTVVLTYFLSFAYRSHATKIIPKIEERRLRTLQSAKVENAESQARKVASKEGLYLSIFYNNAMFYMLLIVLGFFLFANNGPTTRYVISHVVAGFLVTLMSTSKN